MKKKIINGILAAAILIAAPSAFVSCKDNDADLRTELLGKIADLRNQLDKIEKQAGPQGPAGPAGENGKNGSVVTIGDNGNWFIDGVDTKVPAKGEKGDPGEKGAQGEPGEKGAQGEPGTIGSVITIGDNGNWFIDGKDTGVPAKGEKGEKGENGTIGSKVTIGDNGNWFIDGEDTGVPATGPEGPAGKKGTTVALIKGVDGHYYWWLDGNPTGVQADGDGGITINGSTIEPKNGTWWIDGNDTHVLAYTYDEMVKLIKDQIYNAERDGLTPELEAIIKKLLSNLENSVEKSIKNMVTDVIVERTNNSIFGQLAVPGVNPLVIAGYYGKAKANVFFPEDAIDIKGVQEVVMSGGEEIMGDGGKVYFTLNPNEVDIEGKMFSLESSTGNTPNFTFENVQPCTEELNFGWTRAAGSNGLYEATAKMKSATATGINVQSDILKGDVKQTLDYLKEGKGTNAFKSLCYLIADVFTDAAEPMPAYCLKTTWGDQIFGTRTVRSGYDIAAFSVEPLGYDFDFDVNLNTKVYVKKVEDIIDDIIDKAQVNSDHGLPSNVTVHFNTIAFTKVAGKIAEGYVIGYEDNNGNGTQDAGEADVRPKFSVELTDDIQEAINELIAMEGQLGDPDNPAEGTVNYLLKKIGEMDEKINNAITSSKNSVKAAIKDYLNEFNNKVNSILPTNLNKLVQPTLLRISDKGVKRMRGNVKSGTVTLLPTSYTGELLAPAYKKFIAVVEVNGAPATAADNAGQLGQILDGSVDQVEMTVEAGKTYKVAYSAVDYKGNIKTEYYTIKGI